MRFDRTPDGSIWTQAAFTYVFYKRYLDVFDSVKVIARIRDVNQVPAEYVRSDGPSVSFSSLPYYVGPLQYLRNARKIRRHLIEAVGDQSAVLFRVPSQIATIIAPVLRKKGVPFAVQVVGDPYDVFSSGSVDHPLNRLFRWWFVRNLKRQCQTASAVAYVTDSALQKRYPAAVSAFTTSFSDVELSEDTFVKNSRPVLYEARSFRLVIVGTLAQMYKGVDVLIDAINQLVNDGLDLQLVVIGDGKFRAQLEAQTRELNLETRVRFMGQLTTGKAVRDQLDQAEVFTLPSRTEGLPRAMIEAMARGLPCIGSNVNGIPELLPSGDMVPPGDAVALAEKIREVVTNPERMAAMSARNLEKARQYADDVLRERRIAFYQHLKTETEAWLKTNA